MLSEFELGHNVAEATKILCCGESKGAVNPSTLIRWLKKLCLDSKNPDDHRQGQEGRKEWIL